MYTKEQIYDAFSPVFSLMSQEIIETFSGYQYNAGYYTPLKFEVKPIFTDPCWAEVLLHFLENDRSLSTLKQAKHCDYMNVMQEKTFWQLFPKEYASKFEALYTTIGAPCFKEIAEQLAKK